ncbi:MAG: hypothetical protein A2270_05800 [Elusimicrobia bacterium RIFOXYA12_FULL_51_18]|nr:MAG: hypothetical protein A2270_05800 [Elusimicrobia bacterium RIFOXYA12_FULL_51_18]OGS31561.1 MAG: hypothetical protein A2218_03520 [Elusimicrobia bacterium RIFOXYA2_FULL_53_38]
MTAKNKKILDKRFSLFHGIIAGRLLAYRAGPDKDIIVSLETEVVLREFGLRKQATPAPRMCIARSAAGWGTRQEGGAL